MILMGGEMRGLALSCGSRSSSPINMACICSSISRATVLWRWARAIASVFARRVTSAAPFLAVDIKDFWNRWHITLSFWLRDFVFMRFSRFALKHKLFKKRLRVAQCGFMVNMLLMGAWHGLSVNYLLYGLFHRRVARGDGSVSENEIL